MGNIEDVISKFCVQTAVYWGNPTNDGYGSFTFDDPVEISCRWEQKYEVVQKHDGVQLVSVGNVLLTQDVDEEGFLYLGSLSDIDPEVEDNPMKVDGAYQIKMLHKTPMVKRTDDFVRIAYLGEEYVK
jgi:hypothetical protein